MDEVSLLTITETPQTRQVTVNVHSNFSKSTCMCTLH